MASAIIESLHRPGKVRSRYLLLLNSIATDLDYMLNDLCLAAPPTEDCEEPTVINGGGSRNNFKISRDKLFEDYVGGFTDDADESSESSEEGVGGKSVHESAGMSSYDSTLSGQLEVLGLEGGGQGLALPLDTSYLLEASDDVFSSEPSSPCDISTLERLIRTHPIWFLPEIGRAGAVHILRDKAIGTFIVRQSSVPNTMALSVRLPEGAGPDVEHYLVEERPEGLRLEGSDNYFGAIPMLVSHYCDHCDELPVQLVLPPAIMQAYSRQELSSMALLGQDFWTSHLNRLSRAPPTVPSPTNTPFVSKIDSLDAKKNIMKEDVVHLQSLVQDYENPPPSSHTVPTPQTSVMPLIQKDKMETDSKQNNKSSSFTVTTTVTFNVNQSSETKVDEKIKEEIPNEIPMLPFPNNCNTETDTRVVKKLKDNKKVPYYKQSCVLDSLNAYYKGSLADKLSDYEDIWNSSPQKELNKICKTTMEEPVKLISTDKEEPVKLRSSSIKDEPVKLRLSIKEEPVKFRSTSREIEKMVAIPEKSVTQMIKDWDHMKIPCQSKASEHKKGDTPPQVPRKIDPKIFIFETSDANKETIEFTKTEAMQLDNENEFKKSVNCATETLRTSKNTSEQVSDKNVKNEAKKKKMHLNLVEEDLSKAGKSRKFSSPQYSEPFDSLLKQSGSGIKPVHVAVRKVGSEKSRSEVIVPAPKPMKSGIERIHESEVLETMDENNDRVTSNVDNVSLKGNLSKGMLHKLGSKFIRTASLREKTAKDKEKLEIIHPTDLNPVIIGSDDTIRRIKKGLAKKGPDIEDCWPVDSSWEWLANETESDSNSSCDGLSEKDISFPLEKSSQPSKLTSYSETSTLEDLISEIRPDLRTSEPHSQVSGHLCTPPHLSEYDNLGAVSRVTNSSMGTIFSEPWDSTRWDYLLRLAQSSDSQINEWKENNLNSAIDELARNGWSRNVPIIVDKMENRNVNTPAITIDSFDDETMSVVTRDDLLMDDSSSIYGQNLTERQDRHTTSSFQEQITTLLAPPRLIALRKKDKDPGNKIRDYIFRLSKDRNTTFGNSIENFIQCTKDGHETSPHVVLRNVRQFMSGIKNYLVKHGEGQLENLIERERSKLLANEFLNIDAILESALHKIVIKPLKGHIYQCFANEYTRNGSLKLVSDNIRYAKSRTAEEIGIKPEFTPPRGASLEVIRHFLAKLQKSYSPLKKLESLLATTSSIYNSTQEKTGSGREAISLGADDFLPMFIYVLIHCGMISAEIEADYMWGLLHPSLLVGEGGYYLTTLSSAVHVLKNFQSGHQAKPHANSKEPCIGDLEGFMKLMIPDEKNGSIISKTIPVRPNMTTKEVCKMIAHKLKITNSQDYGLFQLIDGQEYRLNDIDCPQSIKCEIQVTGKEVIFAFKRNDAKIAWPNTHK